jgi:hypothetical protein
MRFELRVGAGQNMGQGPWHSASCPFPPKWAANFGAIFRPVAWLFRRLSFSAPLPTSGPWRRAIVGLARHTHTANLQSDCRPECETSDATRYEI